MSRDDDAVAPADFLTMPARFPGISSIWLHAVSFDDAVWPRDRPTAARPAWANSP
ncbi:MAG TPA: hypothetical protein VGI00_09265 [Streptosporangiaceae bacterium]|jgi:hypothetical protein